MKFPTSPRRMVTVQETKEHGSSGIVRTLMAAVLLDFVFTTRAAIDQDVGGRFRDALSETKYHNRVVHSYYKIWRNFTWLCCSRWIPPFFVSNVPFPHLFNDDHFTEFIYYSFSVSSIVKQIGVIDRCSYRCIWRCLTSLDLQGFQKMKWIELYVYECKL